MFYHFNVVKNSETSRVFSVGISACQRRSAVYASKQLSHPCLCITIFWYCVYCRRNSVFFKSHRGVLVVTVSSKLEKCYVFFSFLFGIYLVTRDHQRVSERMNMYYCALSVRSLYVSSKLSFHILAWSHQAKCSQCLFITSVWRSALYDDAAEARCAAEACIWDWGCLFIVG